MNHARPNGTMYNTLSPDKDIQGVLNVPAVKNMLHYKPQNFCGQFYNVKYIPLAISLTETWMNDGTN